LKLMHLGALTTSIVVVMGIALVIPAYTQRHVPTRMILSFTIIDSQNVPEWCQEVSNILHRHNMKAIVFATGAIANEYPECIRDFSHYGTIDLGSQTLNYVNLTSISDYTVALDEIQKGKQAIDVAGNVDSKLFRAPYGSTDDDIYSLLHRSDISADFSYWDHYNKYENNQFVRYELKRIEHPKFSPEILDGIANSDKTVLLNFNNTILADEIEDFISSLKSSISNRNDIQIVNASDLLQLDLTSTREALRS